MRALFEEEDCISRALRDNYKLLPEILRRCSLRTEPPGTQSIVLEFYDENQQYAFMVHFYLRPDRTLGGSGKIDPKSIMTATGVEHIIAKPRPT